MVEILCIILPMIPKIELRVSREIGNEELNALISESWPNRTPTDWAQIIAHSLGTVTAYAGEQLVGFVNIAWDGGSHAFLLDTTVHPDFRRQGIGKSLIERAKIVAEQNRVEWLHVDFEVKNRNFYMECGFEPTGAGLIKCALI